MIKVAIVEDSRSTRESLEAVVNLSPDYRCICACASAEEALRELPLHEPEIVLMDIHLPGMTGVKCVSLLKNLLPQVRVIMITMYRDPDLIFGALRAGACGYLLKRSSPDQVLNAIREAQEGGAPMTGEIARQVIAHFQSQTSVADEVEKLTSREREVLEFLAKGYSNKEIATRLSVSVPAIRWHLTHIYQKLHVQSRTQAVSKFRQA
ncbi:MAG TPA: response regulator transcription factor [Candidatus Sulfotelmatobacter sp.]|jgi:DNA-binding NarL/FixJ family response regulator|nr:response regulator transcription factor [Candidatus Sulfotelmatobacter sp.]